MQEVCVSELCLDDVAGLGHMYVKTDLDTFGSGVVLLRRSRSEQS
jgi:hypothetical protein